jgi:hypothetical protein
MRTTTKGSTLNVYHGGETHNHLCCHGLVAKDKIQDESGQAEQIAEDGLSRYHRSHENDSYSCN